MQDKSARCKTLRLQREHLLFLVGNLSSGIEALESIKECTDQATLLRSSAQLQTRAKVGVGLIDSANFLAMRGVKNI